MDDKRLTSLWRELEQLDLAGLADGELAAWQEQLAFVKKQAEFWEAEVRAERAQRWWEQVPFEERRTLRLLLKNVRLTPPMLQGRPELAPLLLLADGDDPDAVRLWATMSGEERARKIEDLRFAVSLTEHRRTTAAREDEQESAVLAYDILGLSPTASWTEIRKTYRDLAAKHHPDAGGDADYFKALQKAYKQLEARFL